MFVGKGWNMTIFCAMIILITNINTDKIIVQNKFPFTFIIPVYRLKQSGVVLYNKNY